MKFLQLILVCMISSSPVISQSDIVDWTYEIINENDSKQLKITADIKSGWFIYSQHTDPDGPIPTAFSISITGSDDEISQVKEVTKPIRNYSELFEVEVLKFKNEVIFTQVLPDAKEGDVISGTVTYMSCDKSRCLPPKTVPFEVKI